MTTVQYKFAEGNLLCTLLCLILNTNFLLLLGLDPKFWLDE